MYLEYIMICKTYLQPTLNSSNFSLFFNCISSFGGIIYLIFYIIMGVSMRIKRHGRSLRKMIFSIRNNWIRFEVHIIMRVVLRVDGLLLQLKFRIREVAIILLLFYDILIVLKVAVLEVRS